MQNVCATPPQVGHSEIVPVAAASAALFARTFPVG